MDKKYSCSCKQIIVARGGKKNIIMISSVSVGVDKVLKRACVMEETLGAEKESMLTPGGTG